jgi:hypothetical protein
MTLKIMTLSTSVSSAIMLSVVFFKCHAECHYAECRYAECHYIECQYAECRYADYHYAECLPHWSIQGKAMFRIFC